MYPLLVTIDIHSTDHIFIMLILLIVMICLLLMTSQPDSQCSYVALHSAYRPIARLTWRGGGSLDLSKLHTTMLLTKLLYGIHSMFTCSKLMM